MKKRFKAWLYASLMCLSMILGVLAKPVDVWAASASMSGPGTVRAGDTITVTMNLSDSGKFGFEGTLSYNSSQVTLSSIYTPLSGWKLETDENSLVCYDDALSSPTGSSVGALVMTFKVNSSVAAGTTISIGVNNLVTTDGNSQNSLGSATYSKTIAAPLSGNCNLASLSVAGQNLSFNADTTSYNLGEVDFSVSSLSVSATAADGGASVSVSGTNLAVGANTVTVTVVAPNGATKQYNISVTRKQDPNYVASSDTTLSALTTSAGTISPAFKADVNKYIVYLPFEYVGSVFEASGTAADAKAGGVDAGKIDALVAGANSVTVTCKAEDGTTGTYEVIAYVMPEFQGVAPTVEGVAAVVEPEEPDTQLDSEAEDTESSSEDADAKVDGKTSKGLKAWAIILIAFLTLVVGVAGGIGIAYLIWVREKKKEE